MKKKIKTTIDPNGSKKYPLCLRKLKKSCQDQRKSHAKSPSNGWKSLLKRKKTEKTAELGISTV